MSRPRKYDGRKSTQIRLEPELHQRLQAAAEERDLSANFLVSRAIEEFLDRLIPVNEWRLTREAPSAPTLKMACPEVWEATNACHAWGAPSSHGCKLDPDHAGVCQCLCGRQRPIGTYPFRPSDLTLNPAGTDHYRPDETS